MRRAHDNDELTNNAAKSEALERLLSVCEAPVSLISTPYSVEAGFALAQAIKCENNNPPERFCYNPNTDAPQDAGGGWMDSWMRVCEHTKKTNGTVFIVYNAAKDGAYGTGDYQGCFDGQAQQGDGRCCDRCGFTETNGGQIKLLPQLLGAFGPPKANPRVANR